MFDIMHSGNLINRPSMLTLITIFAFPTMALGASVMLGNANVTGIDVGPISKFLGIPFASAPRFNLPVPVPGYEGPVNATVYGPACIQQSIDFVTQPDIPTSEDCLSINVIKPNGLGIPSNLPVAVWFFAGGFSGGRADDADDIGMRVVQKSIDSGAPFIFVSMNYRLAGKKIFLYRNSSVILTAPIAPAFGFLAGLEVQNEEIGNFGLWDQRVALEWVQTYIGAFGGDKTRVTLWGHSAGAISISLQLLAFGGDTQGLFHGAFMQSGAPIPVGSMLNGQSVYDGLVADTDCTDAPSTLECLRTVPLNILSAAVNNSPSIGDRQALHLSWPPRADGIFLQEAPMQQILAGQVANVPIVSGNCDDEGTGFSITPALWVPFLGGSLSTETDFRSWVSEIWVPGATESDLESLWSNYTSDPAEGSPFDTGDADQFDYAQYKRVSAFQGDIVFQAPRRFFLQNISGKQKIWSYLSKRLKTIGGGNGTEYLGSFHGSEIQLNVTDTYAINFINTLNPNGNEGSEWPEYTADSPNMLTFLDDAPAPLVTQDTYRLGPIQYLSNLSLYYPL